MDYNIEFKFPDDEINKYVNKNRINLQNSAYKNYDLYAYEILEKMYLKLNRDTANSLIPLLVDYIANDAEDENYTFLMAVNNILTSMIFYVYYYYLYKYHGCYCYDNQYEQYTNFIQDINLYQDYFNNKKVMKVFNYTYGNISNVYNNIFESLLLNQMITEDKKKILKDIYNKRIINFNKIFDTKYIAEFKNKWEVPNLTNQELLNEKSNIKKMKSNLNSLKIMWAHMGKYIFQSYNQSASWCGSILSSYKNIKQDFSKGVFNLITEEDLRNTWYGALEIISNDTKIPIKDLPKEPPYSWSIQNITNKDFIVKFLVDGAITTASVKWTQNKENIDKFK